MRFSACICVKKRVRKKQRDREKTERKSENLADKKTSSVLKLVICKNAVKNCFLTVLLQFALDFTMRFYRKSNILISLKCLIVVLSLILRNSGEYLTFSVINFLLPRDVIIDSRVLEKEELNICGVIH